MLELVVLAIAIIGLALAIRFRRSIRMLVTNAVGGLLVLLIASVLGMDITVTIWVVLICAIAGIPGAVLVLLLSAFDIAFSIMLLA